MTGRSRQASDPPCPEAGGRIQRAKLECEEQATLSHVWLIFGTFKQRFLFPWDTNPEPGARLPLEADESSMRMCSQGALSRASLNMRSRGAWRLKGRDLETLRSSFPEVRVSGSG